MRGEVSFASIHSLRVDSTPPTPSHSNPMGHFSIVGTRPIENVALFSCCFVDAEIRSVFLLFSFRFLGTNGTHQRSVFNRGLYRVQRRVPFLWLQAQQEGSFQFGQTEFLPERNRLQIIQVFGLLNYLKAEEMLDRNTRLAIPCILKCMRYTVGIIG